MLWVYHIYSNLNYKGNNPFLSSLVGINYIFLINNYMILLSLLINLIFDLLLVVGYYIGKILPNFLLGLSLLLSTVLVTMYMFIPVMDIFSLNLQTLAYHFMVLPFSIVTSDRKSISTGSKRFISTSGKLNPYYITGFVDAEGCFSVSIVNKKGKTGWGVRAEFTVKLQKLDLALLYKIRDFFGVGVVKIRADIESAFFSVTDLEGLKIIIRHFDNYPLITKKQSDFLIFKMIVEKMARQEHLSLEGLNNIVSLRASLNWGLSEKLKVAFPALVPFKRPDVALPVSIDPNWLVGFTEGEGSFLVSVFKSNTKTGYALRLKFQITQHSRDAELMKAIAVYLGCGGYKNRSQGTAGDFTVTNFSDINDKILSFYVQYPLLGYKLVSFNKFCQVAELMKVKSHLTQEGLDKIRQIVL